MDTDYYCEVWETRTHKLLEHAGDKVVFPVVRDLEELTRTKAIELVRRKKASVPWALHSA